jgi:nucleoside-diphosphate-sugar epimerase
MHKTPKNFVIGATSYIGKHIFKKLEIETSVIGTSTRNIEGLLQFNLLHPAKFSYDLIEPMDNIFFVAAISSPDSMKEAHQINVAGTSFFIEQALKRNARIIFFSSDTVYGNSEIQCDESSICNPLGNYALMKNEIENTFLDNALFKSIRLSYVFSKYDKLTSYLIQCDQKNLEAEIFHPFVRAFIYLDDVIDAVIALSSKWNDFFTPIINLGGPQAISRLDFASSLKRFALPNLNYAEALPPEIFFKQRPKVINMKSSYINLLLSRGANTIDEAIKTEFNKE